MAVLLFGKASRVFEEEHQCTLPDGFSATGSVGFPLQENGEKDIVTPPSSSLCFMLFQSLPVDQCLKTLHGKFQL